MPPRSAKLELPWIVGGPNALGRNYQIVAETPDHGLKAEERNRFEQFNFAAADAGVQLGRGFVAFLPLSKEHDGAWLLGRTSVQGGGSSAASAITWGLILSADARDRLGWAMHRLLSHLPLTPPSNSSPPPLTVSLEALLEPDLAPSRLAERIAGKMRTQKLLLSIERHAADPEADEALLAEALEATGAALRRGRGWASTAALNALDSFVPSAAFDWVFAPKSQATSRALPQHPRIEVSAKGALDGAPMSMGESTWHALLGGVRATRRRRSPKLYQVINEHDRVIDESAPPAEAVAYVIERILVPLTRDEAVETVTWFGEIAQAIPAEQPAERFVAVQAVARAFANYVDSPRAAGVQARLLDDCAFIDRLPNAPPVLIANLAIAHHVVGDIRDQVIAERAADFLQPAAFSALLRRASQLSAEACTSLAAAMAQSWRTTGPDGAMYRLAAALIRRGADLAPPDVGAFETLFTVMALQDSFRVAELRRAGVDLRLFGSRRSQAIRAQVLRRRAPTAFRSDFELTSWLVNRAAFIWEGPPA